MSGDATPLSIYLDHRERLIDHAKRILGDHARAEDVVQEAYIRFHAVAHSKPFDEPLAYLYRIVRNLAIDGYRKSSREAVYVLPTDMPESHVAVDQAPTPEAHASGRSDLAALRAAILNLPPRSRLALQLHRIEGKTVKEVAERLGLSVGSTYSLIADGLEICRRRLYRSR